MSGAVLGWQNPLIFYQFIKKKILYFHFGKLSLCFFFPTQLSIIYHIEKDITNKEDGGR
jgi:hypothetical protein